MGQGGRAGSDVCKEQCRDERWRTRTFAYPDSWGCRMDDKYATDRENIANYKACCTAQGDGYTYSDTYGC